MHSKTDLCINNSLRIFLESWDGLTAHSGLCTALARYILKTQLASVCQRYVDYVLFVRDQERYLKERVSI